MTTRFRVVLAALVGSGGVALSQAPVQPVTQGLPPAPVVGEPSPPIPSAPSTLPGDLPYTFPTSPGQPQGGESVASPLAGPSGVGANSSGPAGSPAPAGATTGSSTPSAGPTFTARWNNGLFFESPNKDFTAHVGGTVHFDTGFYDAARGLEVFPGGTGLFQDGAFIRRGRLFAEGSMYKDFDYRFEMEFFNGFNPAGLSVPAGINTIVNSPGPTDAWLQMKNLPYIGNIRIGQQKEPFSLEHLENYRFLTFIERSYLFDASQPTAFNNGFTPGISAFNTSRDERLFGQVGLFKNISDTAGYGTGNGQYAVTGRVAYLPVYIPAEKVFWHVGGAMSHRDPVNGQVQLRVRDQIRNAPFPLLNVISNTGLITSTSEDNYNLETAAVFGSLSMQGEYTANVVNGARTAALGPQGSLLFQGFYAQATYLLTGESRTWNTKSANFNRVIPKQNFGLNNGGLGAFEVAARYSDYDGSDKAIRGGRLSTYTLGLNWYLNPNMKLQFNYDYTFRFDAVNPLARGNIHAFGTRAAFDF